MEEEAAVEMETRAAEDIDMGQDITPPLSPLAFSLYDSFLSSHCSSCFSPIPSSLSASTSPSSPRILYCSTVCSLFDFPLHLSSAESHVSQPPPDASSPLLPSDIRAALRLLSSIPTVLSSAPFPHRIGNLLTNHFRFMADPSISFAIHQGATAMAAARRSGGNDSDRSNIVLEEAALCCVISNAVEVQDKTGRALGIAIYDSTFSWINHSCSPNAFYRLVISPDAASVSEDLTRLRTVPHIMQAKTFQGDSGVCRNIEYQQGRKLGYGPRIIVRSTKRIQKGEEITISYTDLLQPKALRQSDLSSKYQFTCRCRRCTASPPSYVDCALEGVYASTLDSVLVIDSDDNSYREEASRKITDYIEEAIDEFLTNGDPERCCKYVERMLNDGILVDHLQTKEGKSELNFMLNPLHHGSLNAYTTLASAYKIRSSDLTVLNSETHGDQLKAFDTSKTSAAYYLFLAGAAHHLFSAESSLIALAANFLASAGEALLRLARKATWDLFAKQGFPISDFQTLAKFKCTKCSLMSTLESPSDHRDLQEISGEFIRCATNISQEAWSFLVEGCDYLRKFRNPFDFGWHEKHSDGSDLKFGSKSESEVLIGNNRVSVFQLGVHCLLYGGVLADICYRPSSHMGSSIHSLLYHPENYID